MKTGFALLILFVVTQTTVAAEPESAAIKDLQSEYIVDTWQTEQGLPDNYINSVAQTPDGYLWVATFNGLARFNGVSFVAFDTANSPGLPENRITWLTVDRTGRLWMTTETGQIAYWSEGRFFPFSEKDGLPQPAIAIRQIDPEGNLIFAHRYTDTNYYRFIDGAFKRMSTTLDFMHTFGHSRDREGYGWSVEKAVLISVNPGQRVLQSAVPNFGDGIGWRLTGSKAGGMWVIAGRFQKFNQGRWEDFGPFPIEGDLFGGFLEDRAGSLWLGTGYGELWRVGTNHITSRFKLRDAKISELGRQLFEDAEGNLWVGTGGSGLLRLKARALKSLDSRDGLTSDVIRSVTEDRDGNVWLATVNGINCLPHDQADRPQTRYRENQLPWFVQGARDGGLWVGSFAQGLFHYRDDAVRQFKVTADVKIDPPNLSLLETRDGTIYLGTQRGLFTVENGVLSKWPMPQDLEQIDVRSIVEDKSGDIFIGSNGDGLLRKSKSGIQRFTTAEGLPENHIWTLHADGDGGVWIGTHGQGLSWFKGGKFFNFPNLSAALPRIIIKIVEDDAGHLWFASNRGIFRAELRQLKAMADGGSNFTAVIPYDRSDGMGSSQCTGSACKTRDGRIWFTTMNGVTVVDPAALPKNERVPPVVIEGALIDDKPVALRAGETLEVPPGIHRIEIRYAGLSFTAADRVQFRYRLEGLDQDWIEAGNRRFASFTRVPPGEYRFKVIAANNDGLWNEQGAVIAVIAQPYLWQRRWFQVVSAMVLAAAGIGLVRYWSLVRLRRRLAELEQRHALDNERGRISRDLHDSLGADLSQLALWSELALRARDEPDVMARRTQDVSSLTREVIQNVEEIVWTVNPKNDSLDRFAAYLCEFAERVITRAGLRFRWEAPEQIPPIPLPSNIRHHLFLVTKEALNNVVKHAGASEARLKLSLENDRLILVISDDGRGFDMASRPTGNGLGNMRERLAACGGEVKIESEPAIGTSIRINAPLPAQKPK